MKMQAILFFIISFIIFNNLHSQVGLLKVNETFELHSFHTMEGKEVNLDSTDNKVLVMNFWNMGCKGCEQERPYLNELYHKYKNCDVIFWSITMNTIQMLGSFLNKHPIEWKVIGGIDFLGLEGDQTFLIKCMPTTILVDKERKVVYSQCGPILEGQTGNDFINLIDKALSN